MGKGKIDFRLYLITDSSLVTRKSRKGTLSQRDVTSSLVTAVRLALKGGVRAVQLREKSLGTKELLRLACKLRELTAAYSAKLFINDRFDIALAAGADGVHLTCESIPAVAVRAAVGSRFIIGVSTHSVSEARDARDAGADFLTFGPVYSTPSKMKYGEPVGTGMLKRVCGEMSIPVFALGGVKASNMDEVRKSGAYGVAMISGIFGADDIKERATGLINKLGLHQRTV